MREFKTTNHSLVGINYPKAMNFSFFRLFFLFRFQKCNESNICLVNNDWACALIKPKLG